MERGTAAGKGLVTACLAAVAGALLAVFYLSVLFQPGTDAPFQAAGIGRMYESNLVVSEAVISLSFAALALVLLIGERAPSIKPLLLLAAILRTGLLLWQFALHWKPGWYYIMDPADSTATSWTLIAMGLVQVAAFAVSGMKSGNR